MNNMFESDAEAIFAKRLFELCLDHSLYGFAGDLNREVYDLMWAFANVSVVCQSPIEKMLGAALVFANDGRSRLRWWWHGYRNGRLCSSEIKKVVSNKKSIIAPQVEVCGNYRVDFLVVSRTDSGETYLTAIECDGHDYHERTKEQASRDKQRDRTLAAAGITTLRFTGSDIHHRVDECIEEIQDYLAGKVFMREMAA